MEARLRCQLMEGARLLSLTENRPRMVMAVRRVKASATDRLSADPPTAAHSPRIWPVAAGKGAMLEKGRSHKVVLRTTVMTRTSRQVRCTRKTWRLELIASAPMVWPSVHSSDRSASASSRQVDGCDAERKRRTGLVKLAARLAPSVRASLPRRPSVAQREQPTSAIRGGAFQEMMELKMAQEARSESGRYEANLAMRLSVEVRERNERSSDGIGSSAEAARFRGIKWRWSVHAFSSPNSRRDGQQSYRLTARRQT